MVDTSSPQTPSTPSNSVWAFSLLNADCGGQAVQLNSLLQDVLQFRAYPFTVCYYLAELLTVTAMLQGLFKSKGTLTLQLKSDTIIHTLVCEINHQGHMRAYGYFNEEALSAALTLTETQEGSQPDLLPFGQAFGEGYLLLTVHSEGGERYQGIVALQPGGIQASFEHYFEQSLQVPTFIRMAMAPPEQASGWRSRGILVQQTASFSGGPLGCKADDWHTISVLCDTLKEEELLSETLSLNEVLYRLFHEFGVSVYPTAVVQARCRCSLQRMASLVEQVVQEETAGESLPQEVEMTCEYCGKTYTIHNTVCHPF